MRLRHKQVGQRWRPSALMLPQHMGRGTAGTRLQGMPVPEPQPQRLQGAAQTLDFLWKAFQASILKDILTIDNCVGEGIYLLGSRKGPIDMTRSCFSHFSKSQTCKKRRRRWILS